MEGDFNRGQLIRCQKNSIKLIGYNKLLNLKLGSNAPKIQEG